MRKTKYTVKPTIQLKKDYKRAVKRGLKIELLAMGEACRKRTVTMSCPEIGVNIGECHIQLDWLLVCHIEDDVLVLTLARTGPHSDLFDK